MKSDSPAAAGDRGVVSPVPADAIEFILRETGESLLQHRLGLTESQALQRLAEDVATPMHEIEPRLWLGDESGAKDLDALRRAGITHVVNCLADTYAFHIEGGFKYLNLDLSDDAKEDIFARFDAATSWMADALRESPQNSVFVHCSAGVSRSAALLCAFLMLHHRLPAKLALERIQIVRSCADPNTRFRSDLLRWQRKLGIVSVAATAVAVCDADSTADSVTGLSDRRSGGSGAASQPTVARQGAGAEPVLASRCGVSRMWSHPRIIRSSQSRSASPVACAGARRGSSDSYGAPAEPAGPSDGSTPSGRGVLRGGVGADAHAIGVAPDACPAKDGGRCGTEADDGVAGRSRSRSGATPTGSSPTGRSHSGSAAAPSGAGGASGRARAAGSGVRGRRRWSMHMQLAGAGGVTFPTPTLADLPAPCVFKLRSPTSSVHKLCGAPSLQDGGGASALAASAVASCPAPSLALLAPQLDAGVLASGVEALSLETADDAAPALAAGRADAGLGDDSVIGVLQ